MADQRNRSRPRKAGATDPDRITGSSRGVADALSQRTSRRALKLVLRDFGQTMGWEPKDDTKPIDQVRSAVRTYVTQRTKGTPRLEVKEQRKRLAKLQESANRTIVLIASIAPEYLCVLDQIANRDRAREPKVTLDQIVWQKLGILVQAIDEFIEKFKPKAGTDADFALEEVVRELVRIVSSDTGKSVRVQKNKHVDGQATFVSAGARAIADLLRAVDPSLGNMTIANMIEKVHLQPEPSRSNWDELWDTLPFNDDDELDAMLHARCREPLIAPHPESIDGFPLS